MWGGIVKSAMPWVTSHLSLLICKQSVRKKIITIPHRYEKCYNHNIKYSSHLTFVPFWVLFPHFQLGLGPAWSFQNRTLATHGGIASMLKPSPFVFVLVFAFLFLFPTWTAFPQYLGMIIVHLSTKQLTSWSDLHCPQEHHQRICYYIHWQGSILPHIVLLKSPTTTTFPPFVQNEWLYQYQKHLDALPPFYWRLLLTIMISFETAMFFMILETLIQATTSISENESYVFDLAIVCLFPSKMRGFYICSCLIFIKIVLESTFSVLVHMQHSYGYYTKLISGKWCISETVWSLQRLFKHYLKYLKLLGSLKFTSEPRYL